MSKQTLEFRSPDDLLAMVRGIRAYAVALHEDADDFPDLLDAVYPLERCAVAIERAVGIILQQPARGRQGGRR